MNKAILAKFKLIIVFVIVAGGIYLLASKIRSPSVSVKAKPVQQVVITHPEQLKKLLPEYLFTHYRHWALFDPVSQLLITRFFNRYAFHVASSKPIGQLIIAAIKRKMYPSIPTHVIFTYLKTGRFDVNGQMNNSSLPYLNLSLFGYGGKNSASSNRSLHVAQILIRKGANINGVDSNNGRSPLHEAVFMNQHEVVKFLLRHKADPHFKIHKPQNTFHGLNALDLALYMEKAAPGDRYGRIIKTLTLHMLKNGGL